MFPSGAVTRDAVFPAPDRYRQHRESGLDASWDCYPSR